MEILVRLESRGWIARAGGLAFPCAIGRGGTTLAKREGDGATPIGRFPLRGLYYRPDRGPAPRSGLPTWPLRPDLGWSDDPLDAAYNRPVVLPRSGRAERLWRHDSLYNFIVPLGYNDDPPRAGAGSAIFLHVARPGLTGTEGCIALRRSDLLLLLADVNSAWHLRVEDPRRGSLASGGPR